ncbi:bile acid:sodium symporter family protein [Parendozoicomonas haliclonae]|uniref:Sodium Bile acid symporter family protein n=1 Tax=Parendozoicomonas haliclonae TaxID=1960125 RepID=A0A1X7AHW7_9GAMM|nr:bile acid:sodium symporter [Parendozoicomonas haliclonae]SMA42686.1 Sodium Bile acid symporter family protein [Parendozoicomonas haliclonae]
MGAFYIQNEYWFSVFQLVTAMIGMGATLTPKDFREILLEPKAVTSGLAIQLVLVPLITFFFIAAFGLVGGVAFGLAMIAAIPGGSTSNIFTHFAKGNVALSVAITAITTLACLVTTPFILGLLISADMPADFIMPTGRIMKEITLNLLLPLSLGMLYLRFFPGTAEVFSKWCVRISMFGLLMIIVGAASSGRLDIKVFGLTNVALMALFILVMALASWLVSWGVLRLSQRDAIAVDMEVVVRNINLGLMVKVLLFPAVEGQPDPVGDMMLFTLLLYGALQTFAAIGLVGLKRYQQKGVLKAA